MTDDPAASRRALHRSLRSRTALMNVPSTNPSWTAIVNQALSAPDTRHSAIIPGAATVALNQGVIPRIIAVDNTASCPRAPSARSRFTTLRPWRALQHRGRRELHAPPRRTRPTFDRLTRAFRRYQLNTPQQPRPRRAPEPIGP